MAPFLLVFIFVLRRKDREEESIAHRLLRSSCDVVLEIFTYSKTLTCFFLLFIFKNITSPPLNKKGIKSIMEKQVGSQLTNDRPLNSLSNEETHHLEAGGGGTRCREKGGRSWFVH